MTRRPLFAALLVAAVGLAGCARLPVHVPYLPGDRAFDSAEADESGGDRRIDPVQAKHPVVVGQTPPCKFGGKRCPPWERAWPASAIVSPADKVTETGKVVPARAPSN